MTLKFVITAYYREIMFELQILHIIVKHIGSCDS
jgi:hypothetical protein